MNTLPDGVASPEEFAERMHQIVLALSVASIGNSVDILEACVRHHVTSPLEVLSRLQQSVESEPVRRAVGAFLAPTLLAELQSWLGVMAGEAIYGLVEMAASEGDLTGIVEIIDRIAPTALPPLRTFLQTQQDYRERHAQLVKAIASEGMEAIVSFGYIEKTKEAKSAMHEAYRHLTEKVVHPDRTQ